MRGCRRVVKVLVVIATALIVLVTAAVPAEARAVDYFDGSFSSEGSVFSYDVPSDVTTSLAVHHADFARTLGVRDWFATASRPVSGDYRPIVDSVAPGSALDDLPGLPSNAPKPLGLGSTGRVTPNNLTEQLAMTEVRSAPSGIELATSMIDGRWPASQGWVKMAENVNGVEVHYVRNTITGAVDDFKFAGAP